MAKRSKPRRQGRSLLDSTIWALVVISVPVAIGIFALTVFYPGFLSHAVSGNGNDGQKKEVLAEQHRGPLPGNLPPSANAATGTSENAPEIDAKLKQLENRVNRISGTDLPNINKRLSQFSDIDGKRFGVIRDISQKVNKISLWIYLWIILSIVALIVSVTANIFLLKSRIQAGTLSELGDRMSEFEDKTSQVIENLQRRFDELKPGSDASNPGPDAVMNPFSKAQLEEAERQRQKAASEEQERQREQAAREEEQRREAEVRRQKELALAESARMEQDRQAKNDQVQDAAARFIGLINGGSATSSQCDAIISGFPERWAITANGIQSYTPDNSRDQKIVLFGHPHFLAVLPAFYSASSLTDSYINAARVDAVFHEWFDIVTGGQFAIIKAASARVENGRPELGQKGSLQMKG